MANGALVLFGLVSRVAGLVIAPKESPVIHSPDKTPDATFSGKAQNSLDHLKYVPQDVNEEAATEFDYSLPADVPNFMNNRLQTKMLMDSLDQKLDDIFANIRQHSLDQLEYKSLSVRKEAADCYGDASASITILTLASGLPESYMGKLLVNRLALAQHGGYEYCQYSHSLDDARAPAWSKALAVPKLFKQGRKAVFWMDADAVMVHKRKIEDVLKEYGADLSKELIFTNAFDEPGTKQSEYHSINSGVFFANNSAFQAEFWDDIWNKFPETINDMWWEQRAILHYRERYPEVFQQHVNIIGWRSFNTWATKDDGDAFILHVANGADLKKYRKIENTYLNGE